MEKTMQTDTRITEYAMHMMKGHSPVEDWLVAPAHWPYGKRLEYRKGVKGCDIMFDDTDNTEKQANQQLIMCAPLLYQEVVRLRKEILSLKMENMKNM